MINSKKLLQENKYTVTVITSPSSATCTLTYTENGVTRTVSGKTISVAPDTVVNYSVSYTGYDTQSGSWIITTPETKYVTLNASTYTLTVSTSPSSATCTLTYNGTSYTQKTLSGLPYGATVSYSVSYSGYNSQSGSWTITGDTTKSISLSQETYWYEIRVKDHNGNSINTNCTITITNNSTGYSTVRQSSDGTWTDLPNITYGQSVSWSVYHSTYGTKSGTAYVYSNTTNNITGETYTKTNTYSWSSPTNLGKNDWATDGSSSYGVQCSSYQSGHGPCWAFNSNSDQWWSKKGENSSWIMLYSPTPVKVTSMTITNNNTATTANMTLYTPKSGTVYCGDTVSGSYSSVSSFTNSDITKGGSWTKSVSGTLYKKCWKISFANSNGTTSSYTALLRISLSGYYQSTSTGYRWKS